MDGLRLARLALACACVCVCACAARRVVVCGCALRCAGLVARVCNAIWVGAPGLGVPGVAGRCADVLTQGSAFGAKVLRRIGLVWFWWPWSCRWRPVAKTACLGWFGHW
ncbi:hypothetical protein F4780DRAFT_735269 [Xylariomycetidae sp. FL0641]|nr:hypothetical protein F4780DRAFT_735269 [Xylariomycetidae sp. FL0641]